VEYEDRITIATPEGVDLELTLAGVGSRFTSAIVDFVIQSALLIGLALVFVAGGAALGSASLGAGIFAIAAFLLFAGYDIVFEVFASGRTPGKRLNGLRVVRDDGTPVGFPTSAVRNVLRLFDFLPSAYLIGILSILVTRRNQRLGDLAAGTLVVRERLGSSRPKRFGGVSPPPPASARWDVSAVTADELVAVRRFLDRRDELTPEARTRLAADLAGALRAKVAGVQEEIGGETFLEHLAATKAARR
jgi:uncharacterized RDD family membrane protein YckC